LHPRSTILVHANRACSSSLTARLFRPVYWKASCSFASHSIGRSEWARAYYQHLRDDGLLNGFASSFDAGRTVSPTTSPCTCSPCGARGSLLGTTLAPATLCWVETSCRFPKTFWKITLEGITQKTPGESRGRRVPPSRWHTVRQQKALAHIDAAAPSARGFKALR
jgi:hypothetical protein